MSPYSPIDRAVERKSSLCASLGSFGIMAVLCLSVMLVLLHQPESYSPGEPKVAMTLRPLPPPQERRPLPDPEKRYRLLSQVKTPGNPVVPEYLPDPPKPEPRPIPKELPLPPQKAKLAKDTSATFEAAPVSDARKSAASALGRENEVLAELLRVVETRKHYPKQARRIGAEGMVELRVSISQGQISACSLVNSSGNSVLDRATQQLGDRLLGLELSSAKGQERLTVSIPICYVLK